MSTEVNHDSGDSGDTGDSGEHGGYQGGDNGQDTSYGGYDSDPSRSNDNEGQYGSSHESASEDVGHQFSTVQEHMGFTTGFGPAADLPRNAFGVPDYRGFSMPDNKANSLSFGKSPESYGTQRGMTFGTSFDPNNDLRKNAFGVPEYRGFRMPGGEMYSPNEISQPHQPDNASSPQKKELSEAERLMLAGTYGVMAKELTQGVLDKAFPLNSLLNRALSGIAAVGTTVFSGSQLKNGNGKEGQQSKGE